MKIALVTGICVNFDAISGAIVGQAESLSELPGVDDVVIIAQYHDRDCSIRQVTVSDPWALVRHSEIDDADVVVFHWGIKYALFSALPLVAVERQTVVHFHNVTPAALVDEDDRENLEESVWQIQLPLMTGTPIWADSDFNIQTLLGWGFDQELVRLMPFPIETPCHEAADKSLDGGVRLLTVGRLVPAKGVDVLIEAMSGVVGELGDDVSLTLIGSASASSDGFVEALESSILDHGLDEVVTILVDADDDEMHREYERAHVLVSPSLHEGLCVPVIEGYRAGCRVVGTDAGNLPFIVQPPDPIVQAGNADALADAIVAVAGELLDGRSEVPAGAAQLIGTYSEANVIAQLRLAMGDLR